MFTGIVTDIGTITSVDNDNETRFKIATSYDIMSIGVGVSICCSGVCLTVVEKGLNWFAVEVSEETFLKELLSKPNRHRHSERSEPSRSKAEICF